MAVDIVDFDLPCRARRSGPRFLRPQAERKGLAAAGASRCRPPPFCAARRPPAPAPDPDQSLDRQCGEIHREGETMLRARGWSRARRDAKGGVSPRASWCWARGVSSLAALSETRRYLGVWASDPRRRNRSFQELLTQADGRHQPPLRGYRASAFAIVRELAQLMGGEVGLESKLAAGQPHSACVVLDPCAPKPRRAPPRRAAWPRRAARLFEHPHLALPRRRLGPYRHAAFLDSGSGRNADPEGRGASGLGELRRWRCRRLAARPATAIIRCCSIARASACRGAESASSEELRALHALMPNSRRCCCANCRPRPRRRRSWKQDSTSAILDLPIEKTALGRCCPCAAQLRYGTPRRAVAEKGRHSAMTTASRRRLLPCWWPRTIRSTAR